MSAYFKNIRLGLKTTWKGMKITFRHFWNARKSRQNHDIKSSDYFETTKGITTLQYPHVSMPVPDNGRYQLDCEIDDCIVCDKCAKICPVDCIEIDAIKSPEVISYTSDGSPVRLYAAKFDIDMAKCCFCGLCTTVCPTECLTMSSEYDFSMVDITQMNFQFSNLSPEQAERKRELYQQFLAEKEAAKVVRIDKPAVSTPSIAAKPAFKPSFKPKTEVVEKTETKEETKPKPVFKPSFKPKTEVVEKTETKEETKPKPVFKPSFKPKTEVVEKTETKEETKPKPVFKPSFKPKVEVVEKKTEVKEEIKPKPVFKPTFKPQNNVSTTQLDGVVVVNTSVGKEENLVVKAKPVFKPKMKITPKQD